MLAVVIDIGLEGGLDSWAVKRGGFGIVHCYCPGTLAISEESLSRPAPAESRPISIDKMLGYVAG